MDAIRVLVAQHRAIEALFEEVEHEKRRRARASATSRLAEELIAHMAAEEAVFYPAARRVLDAGAEGSARDRDEHLLLRMELRRMLETGVAEASFAERIEALRALFEQHVREEEAELFPRVVGAVAAAQREMWGAEILASRPKVWVVTTEGHPPMQSSGQWASRSHVSLPIPSPRGSVARGA
jgi:hemerythrin superfamily protein